MVALPCLPKQNSHDGREKTELKYFPLFCPRCKQETLINVEKLNMTIVTFPETPDEAFEQKKLQETLYASINELPEKQRRRVIGFYF